MHYVLEANNLTAGYDKYPVIRNLSLSLQPGEKCVLTGSNGTGKTTLIKTLLGLHPAACGTIRLFDRPVPACRKTGIRRQCAYIHQQTLNSKLPVSVREMAALGLAGQALPRSAARQLVKEALEKTGIDSMSGKPYNDLSGGQKQRVQIARCLVQKARLFFLDEPLSSLDPESKKGISALLSGLTETVFVISHEHDYFIEQNWTFLTLKDGRIA